jgi:predicted transcriptional regulator of viral defense system
MDLTTRIRIARRDIYQAFDAAPTKVFTLAQVRDLFSRNREFWRLRAAATADDFIQSMLNVSPLQRVSLEFPHRGKVRYTWREFQLLDLLQSLDASAYFCHYTAIHQHKLTEQVPKTIYLNVEQKRRAGGGTLTQDSLDRAFQRPCRTSSNFVEHEGFRVYMLSGAKTDQLGVIEFEVAQANGLIRLTDLERTLIDATVRPVYSGGPHEVGKAFGLARGHLSVNKLVAYLRKLDFAYPDHQAIGYYLQRAGYEESQLRLLRKIEIRYDFYLAHQMKETDFITEWRLHVPKGF